MQPLEQATRIQQDTRATPPPPLPPRPSLHDHPPPHPTPTAGVGGGGNPLIIWHRPFPPKGRRGQPVRLQQSPEGREAVQLTQEASPSPGPVPQGHHSLSTRPLSTSPLVFACHSVLPSSPHALHPGRAWPGHTDALTYTLYFDPGSQLPWPLTYPVSL
jgi:hypothetical protein